MRAPENFIDQILPSCDHMAELAFETFAKPSYEGIGSDAKTVLRTVKKLDPNTESQMANIKNAMKRSICECLIDISKCYGIPKKDYEQVMSEEDYEFYKLISLLKNELL